MRTYKIPAIGLEIMGEDTIRVKEWAIHLPKEIPKELADQGWRFPTLEEFKKIAPLRELGILALDINRLTGYVVTVTDPIFKTPRFLAYGLDLVSPLSVKHRVRLVRDL